MNELTQKERIQMTNEIIDYIVLQQFTKRDVTIPCAMTSLAVTCMQVIRLLSYLIGEDVNDTFDTFVNGLQQLKDFDQDENSFNPNAS